MNDGRTKKGDAQCLRKLADQMCPDAEVMVVVQDNLNTHSPASRYETFAPAGVQRLAERFEFHYIPGTAVGWLWRRSNWASWYAKKFRVPCRM